MRTIFPMQYLSYTACYSASIYGFISTTSVKEQQNGLRFRNYGIASLTRADEFKTKLSTCIANGINVFSSDVTTSYGLQRREPQHIEIYSGAWGCRAPCLTQLVFSYKWYARYVRECESKC